MKPKDQDTHSFIIRIWREEGNESKWRGRVTHVPSKIQSTFDYFERIVEFIYTFTHQSDLPTEENSLEADDK